MKNENDRLLKNALYEAMTDELESIPESREIEKMHTFSRSFEEHMTSLADKKKRPFWKRRNWYFSMAAAVCCIILIGVFSSNSFKNGRQDLGSGSAEDPDSGGNSGYDSAVPDESDFAAKEEQEIVEEEQELNTQPEEISMQTKEQVYGENDKVTVVIENNSGEEITYGTYYTIEGLKNGSWHELQPEAEIAFHDLAYILQAGESMEEEVDLSLYKTSREFEKYRILKEIGSKELQAEFTIE